MSSASLLRSVIAAVSVHLSYSGPAQTSVIVDVPSTTSIWLAGQADGTGIYQNTAPANSPILIDLAALGRPVSLRFDVTGGTSRAPDPTTGYPLVGGDGETLGTGPNWDQAWAMSSVFDLSGYTGPYSSLVGVFLSSSQVDPIPSSLSFGTPEDRAFAELSPLLQQVFFIGDGLTEVDSGAIQSFRVPSNADWLYLALYDSISWDNSGALRVQILTPGAVPAPPSSALLFAGLFFVVGRAKLVNRRGAHALRASRSERSGNRSPEAVFLPVGCGVISP
jgi:large repetitive protein